LNKTLSSGRGFLGLVPGALFGCLVPGM